MRETNESWYDRDAYQMQRKDEIRKQLLQLIPQLPGYKSHEKTREHEWKVQFDRPGVWNETLQATVGIRKIWRRAVTSNPDNLVIVELQFNGMDEVQAVDKKSKPVDLASFLTRVVRLMNKIAERVAKDKADKERRERARKAEADLEASIEADIEREIGMPIKKLPKNVDITVDTASKTSRITITGLWPEEIALVLSVYKEA